MMPPFFFSPLETMSPSMNVTLFTRPVQAVGAMGHAVLNAAGFGADHHVVQIGDSYYEITGKALKLLFCCTR